MRTIDTFASCIENHSYMRQARVIHSGPATSYGLEATAPVVAVLPVTAPADVYKQSDE